MRKASYCAQLSPLLDDAKLQTAQSQEGEQPTGQDQLLRHLPGSQMATEHQLN
jgi:hypothetical protein